LILGAVKAAHHAHPRTGLRPASNEDSGPLAHKQRAFRRGFSYATEAKRHLRRPYLWNIDLEDFFPSITKSRVVQAFTEIGCSKEAASVLASLTCLDERLPQGAPTSAALANYIFFGVDVQISEMAQVADALYTRFADDLSFSTLAPIHVGFQQKVRQIVHYAGFRINERKTRLMGPKCCRQVTRLTVNEKLSIPRQKRRQLRARFRNFRKNPAAFSSEKERMMGFASRAFEHHPAGGRDYLEVARSIPEE
jgi:RNA-directed DNA polymerase